MKETDVAIIGGGSTGCSILYHMAKKGLHNSLLVEKGPQAASGQTSKSTALVRTHYTNEIVAKMALLSYEFFRNFQGELGGRTAGYVETGLIVGADEASTAAVKESVAMFHRLGIVSNMIDNEEAKRIEPMLDTSGFATIVYEPHMGYAEPSTTTAAFLSAARELGAEAIFRSKVTEIRKQRDRYLLSTTNGEVRAKKVVLATGPWSKPILKSLGIDVPLKAVRHPVVIYRRPEEYRGNRPVIFDIPRSAYYKPEGGYLFVVGSLEPELDSSSGEVDPDNYPEGVTFDEVLKFSNLAAQAFPVMATKGAYERGYAGVYDNTPDQQPIIDELSDYGFEGLFCLIGLSGHGFKLCPEFGRIMASIIVDESFKDYDVSAFKVKRFEAGQPLTGKYRVSTIG